MNKLHSEKNTQARERRALRKIKINCAKTAFETKKSVNH